VTPAEFKNYIHIRTHTDDDTFPDADILAISNAHIDELAMRITAVNEDYFGAPAFANLIADQREYALPDDLLNQIKVVEAQLDGENWLRLDEFDLNTYKRTTNEEEIVGQFANQQHRAFFDIFRRSLFIYSGEIIDVTGGLKLWSFFYPAHITNLASVEDMSVDPNPVEHGFPRQFHKILADYVVVEYKTSRDSPLTLTESEQLLEKRTLDALDALKGMNLDRITVGHLPPANVRGDEGFDY